MTPGPLCTPVDGERPLADLPAAERQERFSGPAETYVKPGTVYIATIVTAKGNIVAELYQDTPESLNNFVTLALNGYYDGLTFHRVEPGFVVQGGDPAGDGTGGRFHPARSTICTAAAAGRTGDQVNPGAAPAATSSTLPWTPPSSLITPTPCSDTSSRHGYRGRISVT